MEFKYFMPARVIFGENCILENKNLLKTLGSKALIVTGRRSAKANGSYDDVSQALTAVGIDYLLFDEVEENPSIATVEKGASLGKAEKVDFVIGIGGGSPMDASKAMAVLIKNPTLSLEEVFTAQALDHIPVVAVATTSGTGSEVTQFSIVTDSKAETKRGIGQTVFAEIAFVDSKYTISLPYDVTVNTAIDAFSHLVEGYLNVSAHKNCMSDLYGEAGFELFKDCFENLLKKNLDKEFREKVMFASTLGGIQIAQNTTSLPHGMGYALTYHKGVPHGLANGVLLIEYLKTFSDQSKINKMLKLLGLKNLDELAAILDKLIDLELEITEEEIMDYARAFTSNDEKLKSHPEKLTLEGIAAIYKNSLKKYMK